LTGGQALSFDAEAFRMPCRWAGNGRFELRVHAGRRTGWRDGEAGLQPGADGFAGERGVVDSRLREGLINELLRALPKSIRRELMPFPPKVVEILRDFRPAGRFVAVGPRKIHP